MPALKIYVLVRDCPNVFDFLDTPKQVILADYSTRKLVGRPNTFHFNRFSSASMTAPAAHISLLI
ncbi:MAG TPA: hypothetical protein VF595_09745 [Tepidisphaeraceae bacterium]